MFLVGRVAFRRNDKELMKILLAGLFLWLAIEAFFSLYLGVFFNAGVDAVVLFFFGVPLTRGIARDTVAGRATTSQGSKYVTADGCEHVVGAEDERKVP